MKKTDNFIFQALHIIAWIIFVGLCIEAGALLVNFVYSMFNPKVLHNLYQKLDLSELYTQSKWTFFGIYSFILIISILKAYLFYIVVKLTSKLNLIKPFTPTVLKQIHQISYYTFSIGLISYIAQKTSHSLSEKGYVFENTNQFWVDSSAFIVMAAILYVVAIIFNKGIELQSETDLTI